MVLGVAFQAVRFLGSLRPHLLESSSGLDSLTGISKRAFTPSSSFDLFASNLLLLRDVKRTHLLAMAVGGR